MSVLYEDDLGYYLSHADFIREIYKAVKTENNVKSFQMIDDLFDIKSPYTKPKAKNSLKRKTQESIACDLQAEVQHVKNRYELFRSNFIRHKFININAEGYNGRGNEEALRAAQTVYSDSGKFKIDNTIGENRNEAIAVDMHETTYLFPKQCKFYCSCISNITKHLADEKFDVILLDPPWWNKYIRRKKLKTNNSYTMMYNDDLKEIPIENLLDENGIVVVWCTNSTSHLNYLKMEIFKKWRIDYMGKWYWMKVTDNGEPICNFSDPPGKQPFEQIIFGSKSAESYANLPSDRLIVSIPSALHSHKPPLYEVLRRYIPENAKCLEIFARYLLPNWTSYGLEVIRFQHCSLYRETTVAV